MSISSHSKLARGKKKGGKQLTNEAQDFKASGYYYWFLTISQLFGSLLICFFFLLMIGVAKNWELGVPNKLLFSAFPEQEGLAGYPTPTPSLKLSL